MVCNRYVTGRELGRNTECGTGALAGLELRQVFRIEGTNSQGRTGEGAGPTLGDPLDM